MIDRLLKRLTSRSLRRGLAGDPMWLAVGVAAFVVQRLRHRQTPVVWSGRLAPGERLVVSAWVPGETTPAPPPA